MKIILSTYNFYPAHRGGTEVYTKALAAYLSNTGKEILVIAALDDSNEVNGKIIANNEEMKAVWYLYEGIHVLGIQLKKQSAEDVYAGLRQTWTESFAEVLVKMDFLNS